MPDIVRLSIGRSKNCDIVFSEDITISRHHAFAEIHYYDLIYLTDNNSANGVFVNDVKIKRARIKTNDCIRLGSYKIDNSVFFGLLFDKYKVLKPDFFREYEYMLGQFRLYQERLDKFQENPRGPIYFKLGLLLLFIFIILIFYDQIDQRLLYPMIIGISGLTLIGGLFSGSRGKRSRRIAQLKVEYEKVLRCPRCNNSFLNMHLIVVEDMDECPNESCKAKFKP